MKEQYTYQDLETFFDQFKRMPEFISLEKVAQIIQHPSPAFTLPTKGASLRLWPILLSTTAVITIASILYFSSTHNKDSLGEMALVKKEILPPVANIPAMTADTVKLELQEVPERKRKQKADEKEVASADTNDANRQSIAQNPKILNTINTPSEENHVQIMTSPNDSIGLSKQNENNKDTLENSIIKSEDCNWPLDTIIDRQLLLVELTDSELYEIGIVKYGNSVYYNNISSNGHANSSNSNIYSYIGESETIPDEKKIQTNYEFYRVLNTTIDYVPYFNADLFYSSVDTLVPIILRVGVPNTMPPHPDKIYWFNPHETLFDKLPVRYNYLKDIYLNLQCLKRKYPNKTFTNYFSAISNNIYNPVNSLYLDREELRQIGINMIGNCIVLQSKDFKETSVYGDCNHDENYYDTINLVRVSKSSMPILKTDTLGREIDYHFNSRNYQNIEGNINVLIPIEINKNELFGVTGFFKTELWWYNPTDEFIQTLPNRIKNDLKLERDAIISQVYDESTSCTFFEVCESSLLLNDLKLYPNPARLTVTLEFSCSDDLTGSISLINLSGAKIKELLPTCNIQAGMNSYVLELQDIETGIYLVSINTDKGFRTQRLILSK